MRFFLTLALVFCSALAMAQGVPAPSTPRLMIDAAGTLMDATNPLPVTGSISVAIGSATFTASGALDVRVTSHTASLPAGTNTIGSVTVTNLTPHTTYQSTSAIATAGTTLVAALSARRFCAIVNLGTETVWINPGSTTAVVSSGIPVYTGQYWSDSVDAAIPVPFIASTDTTITIVQGK